MNATTTEKPKLEKINKAARGVGISGKFVRKMIADGKLTAYALSPKILLVDPAELRAIVEACRVTPSAN